MRDFRRCPTLWLLSSSLLACGGLAGCGLKGALELPERPSNIVIRPAPGTPPAGTTQTPAPGTAAPAPAKPAEEPEEPLPPPDLPRGQRGGAS